MAYNVTYRITFSKSFNYDQQVISDIGLKATFDFSANTPDPLLAGLMPYYRSADGLVDAYFQNIITTYSLQCVDARIKNINWGPDGGRTVCNWTEQYATGILATGRWFDVTCSINVPAWDINFIPFLDFQESPESRQLRQVLGLTHWSGNFDAATYDDPTSDYTNWMTTSLDSNVKVLSHSLTEGFDEEAGVPIYRVKFTWASYALYTSPPQFW